MALQLILGSSGSGKSHYINHKIIEESIQHPEREYLVLVPEQFTMQTQKELVQMHPGGGILNIDVLSFQRLAYRVFEEVGGDSRRLLEETGKTLVLEKVVQSRKKELGYLGSQMHKPGYIKEMKSLISELMQYGVEEQGMEKLLGEAENKALLFQKMKDVQVLYRGFRKYLEDRFLTAEEVLDLLCRRIGQSEKIRKSVIVLDGFTGFTPIQYKVIEELLVLSPRIYVTVTLDEREEPFSPGKVYHLFSMSRQMCCTLRELAGKTKTRIAQPYVVRAGEHSRFAESPELNHLEQNLFRYKKAVYQGECQDIQMFTAANPLREMTEVSRRIARLVRERGYRYGDIAVITGDLETYANYATQVFEEADIPCFIDQKHSVLMNPFVEFIRSALDVMTQNFSYESVFRHLRCQMTDVMSEEADRLENYVIALGIRSYKKWNEKWVRLYRGLPPEEIGELNSIREKVLETLTPFAEAYKKRGNTVREYTHALYTYITRNDIQKKLKVQEQGFARRGDQAMEKEYAQIYGIVMNLLDKLVEILGEEKVSQKEYMQLIEAGLSDASVGIIPPSADQVLVGDMERTRLKDIKALFFVGVNDGIIPKNTGSGGILSEPDREFFKDQGVALAPTPKEAMYMQRFYLYLNLTKPSCQLCLSYSQANAQGDAMGPAYLTGSIRQLFPALDIVDVGESEKITDFERPQDSLDALVAGFRRFTMGEPQQEWKELYNWFAAQEEYQEFIRNLIDAAFYRRPSDKISASVAKALYGEISMHSATRLEKFSACAFAHFLQYGLALAQRQEYEFTPADMGNVMHNALEHFSGELKQNGLQWKELSDEERERMVDISMSSVVDDYGNTILHSSARNEYMINRVRRLLNRTVWALQNQMVNSEFTPEGFEVSIGGGRIDRLDICELGDKVLVRIMDYKTGGTTFDLLSVYHGLQLQLMIYMDGALEIERKNHPDKAVEPAGIFYYNIKDPVVKADVSSAKEEVERQIMRELRMNGLAAADKSVLDKMDSTLESLPVSFNKNGSFSKTSSVATQEQFQLLERFVKEKIKNIKTTIEQGEAEIAPYELGRKNGCMYCPYSAVCGFDQKVPGYEYRRLSQYAAEEIWQVIAEVNNREMREEAAREDGNDMD